MPLPKFIVLEGGEGSGKTGCLSFLKKQFSERENIVFTRTPNTDTEFGKSARALLLDTKMKPAAELLLFLSMHTQFVEDIVLPAFKKGKHVICDRFLLSTYAYQMRGRRLYEDSNLQHIYLRAERYLKYILPVDPAYIVLGVAPLVGLKRKKEQKDTNKFEEEDLVFHERVREGFSYEACESGYPLIETTGKTAEEVHLIVFKQVQMLLNSSLAS